MLSIQTNVNSLIAQQNLNVNNQFQSKTIQQLTSGYRINSSGDDAAGLAVANKFRNNISEVTQGVANGNDAVAQLQIMDGGMNNISQILDRLKTLATQSASASFTGDRSALNNEFQTDITEINRQAQAIGLNTGGTSAKSLAIYLGGGQGASAASTLANGTVTVDLSKSTVDAQSLGLQGVQAVNLAASVSNDYDIGNASASSVSKILSTGANATFLSGSNNLSSFTFTGPGFGDSNGVQVSVNMNGVSDAASLVTNINSAIQLAGQGATSADASFKAANITASIHTDSLGNQQLAFNSSNAAFQVTSGDVVSSALMGSFVPYDSNNASTTGAPFGTAAGFSVVSGGANELGTAATSTTPAASANLNWADMLANENQVISISANDASGASHSLSVKLNDTNPITMANALSSINNALQKSNDSTLKQITAVQTTAENAGVGAFNFISTLPSFTISVGTETTGLGVTSDVGKSVQSVQVGTGSSGDIGSLQGATNAVSAVSAAVGKLGTAQAAIGKGENQLSYAINLATSQITNFSAAESQIKDADVAQQAANLTKAQVLQQASIAAMAQANSAPQAVLSLLKG